MTQRSSQRPAAVEPDMLGRRGDQRWRTTGHLLADATARFGQRLAVIDADRRLSYADLNDEARRMAAALIAHGTEVGDTVAIWAPNSWRWVVAALGAHLAGAAVVPVNTRYRGPEAAHILSCARPRILFVANGFLGNDYLAMLEAAGAGADAAPTTVVFGDRGNSPGSRQAIDWESFAWDQTGAGDADRRRDSLDGSVVSDVLFTSGTTGTPKGVVTTHSQNLRAYYDYSRLAGFAEGDRYAIVNPFFHAFGYKVGWLSALMHGMTMYPHAVLDTDALLDQIEQERIQVLPGPPTLYTSLLADPSLGNRDLSSLRVAITGAASTPAILIRRMYEDLGFERVVTCYGMTEGTGVATISRADDDLGTLTRASGRPLPGIELRVVGDDGVPAPAGELGEVWIRGYNVMRGYLGSAAAAAQRVDPSGWLHTGDIGHMDTHGNLSVTDRKSDMFVVGGFNAYPAEIESALAEHPEIREAAVIGIPDERLGEVGMAFIVPSAAGPPAPGELIAWARERLANFKVPRRVTVVDELPRNPTGKVLKTELRRIAAQAQKKEYIMAGAPSGGYLSRIRFDGKGFLVLGAGQGMGRASVQALSELGAQVYCADLDADLAKAAAAETGGIAGTGDVTIRQDVQRLVDSAASELDHFAGVIDVVGMARWAPLLEMDDETWQSQHDIVLRHAYLTVQIAGRKLAELGRGGAIAFVSSASGITGAARHAAYGAAKAGLINLVKSAAVEMAPLNVRVNAVAPGIVLTDRLGRTLFQDPGYRAGQLANVPMGRLGAVEDIAGALVFLVSDLAAYITGTTIQVDGGVQAKFGYVTPD